MNVLIDRPLQYVAWTCEPTLDICVRKSSADDHNQYYHYEKESAPIHNYAIGMRYIGLSPSASSQ